MSGTNNRKKLTIEQVAISRLRPNPNNPRINDSAVDAVARSISEFGFNAPIVTDGKLKIAAGHTRLKAAEKLGIKTVPVVRIPGLRGSKFTGYSIADNQTASIATWDEGALAKLGAKNKDNDNTLHGVQKPVECMARPIRNHGKRGDFVYDPFVGSGTTIIACEKLGRRCLAMDIDPIYVDVAVERWQQFTGGKAKREASGCAT